MSDRLLRRSEGSFVIVRLGLYSDPLIGAAVGVATAAAAVAAALAAVVVEVGIGIEVGIEVGIEAGIEVGVGSSWAYSDRDQFWARSLGLWSRMFLPFQGCSSHSRFF